MNAEPKRDRATGEMPDPLVLAPNAIHLVRNLQITQQTFTRMADQKANILLAASSIVFTVTLTQLRAGGAMILPLSILALAGLLSAICAILTARPSVTRHKGGPVPDEANLLFFGIFTGMAEDDFIEHMLPRLRCDEAIYRTMLRDVYQSGSVLHHRKYRMLSLGYQIFLAGMIMSGVAALVVLLVP